MPASRRTRSSNASRSRNSSRANGAGARVRRDQLEELLLQALETEMGGIEVYRTALRCVDEPELEEEWENYLDQTREHERILLDVFDELGWDPDRQTAGRDIVHHTARSLVTSMEDALSMGRPGDAQLVAAECVVLAETKDHHNWQLIGEVAKALGGREGRILMEAHEKVEHEEDEHLYHTMGWARELWLESLGLPAAIPPPEETMDVRSAEGAARAKKSRRNTARKRPAKATKRRSSNSRATRQPMPRTVPEQGKATPAPL